MCKISIALINAVYKEKMAVCTDIENIFYDKDRKKVYFITAGKRECPTEEKMCLLFKGLRNECRYAGSGTYEFMNEIYETICLEGYEACEKYLESFIESEKQDKKKSYCLYMIVIVVCEIIYLFIYNTRFY